MQDEGLRRPSLSPTSSVKRRNWFLLTRPILRALNVWTLDTLEHSRNRRRSGEITTRSWMLFVAGFQEAEDLIHHRLADPLSFV